MILVGKHQEEVTLKGPTPGIQHHLLVREGNANSVSISCHLLSTEQMHLLQEHTILMIVPLTVAPIIAKIPNFLFLLLLFSSILTSSFSSFLPPQPTPPSAASPPPHLALWL